ncbi:hypothetical protein Tco_1533459 [Tanacetum coccineum]
MIWLRAASPLPLFAPSPPLLLPSITHRDDLLEADMPLRKRARFTSPTDASICTSKSRVMTAIGEVNERVIDLATTQRQKTHELQIKAFQRDVDVLQRQRIRDEDRQTSHFQYENDRFRELVRNAKAGPQDGPTDAEMPPKRTATTTTAPMTNAAIKQLIAQGVADALVETKANRTSRNGEDSHDSRTGSRRTERAARECTYSDLLKFQPLNFKGTGGVVSLTQWFEKMEFVFHISNCTVVCHIKFATCTLLGSALTWWNSHIKTVGHDAAYEMPWKTLKKMMTAKYFPKRRDQEARD